MAQRTTAERIWYTPPELNRISGVCEHRIRRAIKDGAIPASRVGKWNRIRFSDFEAWMDAQRVRVNPDTIEIEVDRRVAEQLRREAKL